jgi:catechol 2,3-dioxygenase-like lactoylglutathione lyase family enzyme
VIDHVSLGSTRYAESVSFYQSVLAALDIGLQRDTGVEAAFGSPSRWSFYVYPAPAGESVTGRGTHLAFQAPTRAAVMAAHERALAASGQDIFSPRERPDISATYYGAMFLDPDGHRIEVLTHAA